MNEDYFAVTRDPIDKANLEQQLLTAGTGALVTFDGTVRAQTGGRAVIALHYEAYPSMAEKELRKVGAEMRARWPELERIGIVHRFGELQVKESSVVIVVCAPHRKVAFAACHYAIDRLKETVPVWKKEIFADGAAWVEGHAPIVADAPTGELHAPEAH